MNRINLFKKRCAKINRKPTSGNKHDLKVSKAFID